MQMSPPPPSPDDFVLPEITDDVGTTVRGPWTLDATVTAYPPTVRAFIRDIDGRIEALREQLLLAQPFGSLRIDLRWYLATRSERRDPVPVRYVLNSPARVQQGAPKWAVIRLDRGEHLGMPLYAQLRTSGPLHRGTVEYRDAKKIAISVQVLLDERKASLKGHGALMSSLGRRLAAMQRSLARSEGVAPCSSTPLTFNDPMDAY